MEMRFLHFPERGEMVMPVGYADYENLENLQRAVLKKTINESK